MSSEGADDTAEVTCAIIAATKAGQRHVGACVRRRIPRANDEDTVQWALELFDFLDNEQYSNLDCFLVQVGACTVLVADDIADAATPDMRKIHRIFENRPQTTVRTVKKQLFKKTDSSDMIRKLVGKDNHETTVAEVTCAKV